MKTKRIKPTKRKTFFKAIKSPTKEMLQELEEYRIYLRLKARGPNYRYNDYSEYF